MRNTPKIYVAVNKQNTHITRSEAGRFAAGAVRITATAAAAHHLHAAARTKRTVLLHPIGTAGRVPSTAAAAAAALMLVP